MEKPIPKPNPPTHFRPPDTPFEPMEFLSRSWSPSAVELSRLLTPSQYILSQDLCANLTACCIQENVTADLEDTTNSSSNSSCGSSNHTVSGNPFSFANDETSVSVVERIMSQSQEASPRTSGRLSHSSGPLNGSLTDSPPVSPSELDDAKSSMQYCRSNNPHNGQFRAPANPVAGIAPSVAGVGGKTMGRWLKDKREKKKEDARVRNTQLHAAISVAGVAAAVAAMAAATVASSASGKEDQMTKTNMAVASAATLVAAQCVEAAEAMGADREQLASIVNSAVNVRSAGDIMTLTAAAATALRGAATLKARALKDVWNIAAVIPVERGIGGGGGNGSNSSSNSSFSGELVPEENFLGVCSNELLARGCELLKRTRKGDLHWKIVSVYINKSNQVMLKMKSRHVAGTITKKKKSVVLEVIKNVPAWPGRHLLQGGEHRRYFGLKTVLRGVIEFECLNQREHDIWTRGVSRLLSAVGAARKH